MKSEKEISRYLLCLFCCMVFMLSAKAQRYPFFNLDVEDGLIQSQAGAIAQDRFGHLWVGTLGGLSRYDGRQFINYTVRDGMPDNIVQALAVDKQNNLWIGSGKGLSVYNGRRFKTYVFETADNPGGNSVADVAVADNGAVWCRAGGKIYSVTQGKSKPLPVPGSGIVTAILPDGGGLWAATTGGVVYRHHNNKWDSVVFNEPRFNGAPFVTAMFKRANGTVYLCTNRGLYTIAGAAIKVVTLKGRELYDLPTINSGDETTDGSLWLGTSSGALRIKDSSLYYYRKSNGLTDNIINEVLADAEGNIWMASDGQGLFRFSGAQFTVVDESVDLPSAQVMSIMGYYGKLFLGTYDAGLYTYEQGKAYNVPLPIKPAPAIMTMRVRRNELWLGTRGAGLLRYNGSSFKSYTMPTLVSNYATSMYTDTSGRLWLGFINGAMIYEGDSFRRVKMKNAAVQDFVLIGTDSVLLATDDGIKLYHGDVVADFVTGAAPDSSSAQCFALKGNSLWIGTSDNGVIIYDLKKKTSRVINKNNGLHSDFIYNIIIDNDGNTWVGTGYGIHKIVLERDEPHISFYGKGQGIEGMESNHNAVYKMKDGSIWFGTTNGALHYHPQSGTVASQPISIVLQSVKVFGEAITDSSFFDSTDTWYNVPYHLHLPYKKNNITFTFHAISLSGTEQVQYRYRIEGLDAQWSDWSSVNTVTYSALPPGKYVLQVDCVTESGTEVQELKYPFEIVTPFHKTGWFRLIILGGCILLGVTIQYIVNRRKQNRQALLDRLRREEQAKVRLRTAEDFHDEVGNKLTRINVLTNVLQKKVGDVGPDVKRIIGQIQDNTNELYGGTRDILWSLKPTSDNLAEILFRIRDFGGDLFQDTDIDFYFRGDDDTWRKYRLPMDVSRNLIMIFKEALNNILKYAKATNVTMEIEIRDRNALRIKLTDNGIGFDLEHTQKGHGIDNMNVRAKRINGILYIDTKPGKGTITTLTFRLPQRDK